MKRDRRQIALACAVIAVLALAMVGCSDDGDDESAPTETLVTRVPTYTPIPGVAERVTLRGNLTLDGAPLETEFLGARVVRDGLAGACQDAIPSVAGGEYELPVAADAEVRGCGAPGAEIVLWAHVSDDLFLYSKETIAWPGDGGEATFDATFSMADPAGATRPATGIKGLLFDADGEMLPGGSVVEAFIDGTLCGETSLRYADATDGYYTLTVAGPESLPACAEGAPIEFRIDGKPADGTAINDLGAGANGEEVNLTLR